MRCEFITLNFCADHVLETGLDSSIDRLTGRIGSHTGHYNTFGLVLARNLRG